MSRFKRLYYSQAVYHVIFRGNNRQAVLKSKQDKEVLLRIIEHKRKRLGFLLYGFVVMDNHTHLVIETNSVHNISRVMQSILLSYSCWFRRTYDYVGHVWQGRFKSYCISTEQYLRECIEYIHENPVRAGMIENAQQYMWSSAGEYANEANDQIHEILMITKYGMGDTSGVSH